MLLSMLLTTAGRCLELMRCRTRSTLRAIYTCRSSANFFPLAWMIRPASFRQAGSHSLRALLYEYNNVYLDFKEDCLPKKSRGS